MSFTDFVGRYQLARSEGLVLRYLTDAYRTLRQTVPEAHRTPELEDLIEWLGETVRQTDSSLLDEWEALTDPDARAPGAVELAEHRPPTSPRPISQQERAFRVMVRNAMFRRVRAGRPRRPRRADGARAGRRRPHRPAARGRDDPLGAGTRRSRTTTPSTTRVGTDARRPRPGAAADRADREPPAPRTPGPAVAGPPDARTTPRATTTG